MKQLRNFCIIAHIDHGKSTLADRLLQTTNTVGERQMMDQVLDDMDLEREKGITIKSKAIQLNYNYTGSDANYTGNRKYTINLIDTPGHVDFSYEVSRALAACEGALLLVDAAQGIQAQTISNLYLALENDLEIIPVINKIDMPGAMIEEVEDQIIELIGCKREDILHASGRTGLGVERILESVIERIPAPVGDPEAPLQALIFDSVFNSFRGIIVYFRIVNGSLKKNDKVRFIAAGKDYIADEVGILKMRPEARDSVQCGDVGYIITGIKNAKEVKVGDTITLTANQGELINGFEEVKPMVFAGIYPVETDQFEELRDCMEKLQLNDASLTFELETSQALGFGFRCGFLGMLHMEIIQERLEREFDQTVITTVPNVSFKAITTKGENLVISNPSEMPEQQRLEEISEPFIRAQIITKPEYIGNIMTLCIGKRGIIINQGYLTPTRVELIFELPLTEIVFDFYDKLKSQTRGYASFDYHPIDYRTSDIAKMDILLNGDKVDALSALIHRSRAHDFGRKLCEKLKDLLPRQQFMIAIQAAIGAKIVARETISAMRKDVTAKCYGGDISRKRKLLEKQKEGKKRMRQIGNVEVPQEAFLAVLKLDD
ncbi:translation elongation factor 4 [Polluticaenibacter yanchengensis]|uniref:Elongation factor 4 n=1 Tax=Polluticaenibacter yanchengensis TaxID=3014562 RepID=A0ABT4UG46_9BACT|nr:translation elongation factor 4 [Chitinophagaceae bacterium LY-5]